MTAREKFLLGERVKSSNTNPRYLVNGKVIYGVVRGFGNKPHLVRIKRDDRKEIGLWHMDFWETMR